MNAVRRTRKMQPAETLDDRWCDVSHLKNSILGIRYLKQDIVMLSLSIIYVAGLMLYGAIVSHSVAIVSLYVALGGILLWLTWVDRQLQRLPNVLVGAVALLALLAWLMGCLPVGWLNAMLGALVGGGAFLLLALGMERLTGRPGLGMGDVKLLAALGLWTGVSGLPLVVLLASWAALPWALWVMLRGERERRLPFGPFLCLAGWMVTLFQPLAWQVVARLMGHSL